LAWVLRLARILLTWCRRNIAHLTQCRPQSLTTHSSSRVSAGGGALCFKGDCRKRDRPSNATVPGDDKIRSRVGGWFAGINLVSAAKYTSFGVMQYCVFVKDLVDCSATTHRIIFAKYVAARSKCCWASRSPFQIVSRDPPDLDQFYDFCDRHISLLILYSRVGFADSG
jgi:hypothetical protein